MRFGRPQSYYPVLIALCLLFQLVSCKPVQHVNLVIHDAVIYTADNNFSVKQAMAINDGKIVAAGSNEEILNRYNGDKVIDARGKFIYPGLIDAHCHFTGYATDMWKCDLTGTNSFSEIVERLKQYSTGAGTNWLYGRGWDQNDWTVKEFPDKKIIDSLFPSRPVFLKRIDGHAALANQAALDIAGITGPIKINGGEVEVKNGHLTGLLLDNAMQLVEDKIPLITDTLARRYFLQLQDSCFQYGLTTVHDCGVSEHSIKLVDEAQQAGSLKMKIVALLNDDSSYYDRWIKKGPYKTSRLHVAGFKIYADGALGSRGACLLQPYTDKPGWHGFLLGSKEHFRNVAERLAGTNFQMCTHAIGDSANKTILAVYASVLKAKNDRRWRIEHAQVINGDDLASFGSFSIIPSVQPTHATSDMYWAPGRLGETRIKNAYAYRQLLMQNNWLPLGTDFPVEDINPFKTFYAAVARMDNNGFPPQGFQKENALSRKEALLGMTLWAAKAAFEENEKGSLEAGKAADFFILDKDLINCNISEVLQAVVSATFSNGEQVFAR